MDHLKTHRLHFLLGKWSGVGTGQFPTITPFSYKEILTFNFDGHSDLIHYEQRTWLIPNDIPSHWESGFIKPVEEEENVFEISNAQDSGRVEVLRGEYFIKNGTVILHFKMKLIQNDPRLVSSERIFTIRDNQLSYVKKRATKNTPVHQQHLQATLFKC